jgi:tRNA A37 methylthiotransferase MiaB
MDERTREAGRTYDVRTYGCQMNIHDSERLSGLLEQAGYQRAEAATGDVVVFNTLPCVRTPTTSCTATSVSWRR